jgi:hypothetical protein
MRRREEDARPRLGRAAAELESFVDGLGAVIAGGDDVGVDVDEHGVHLIGGRLFGSQVEAQIRSRRLELAQCSGFELADALPRHP